MIVEVKELIHPVGMFDTMLKFRGVIQDTEDEIIFAVDHRPAKDLLMLLNYNTENEDPTFAEVPEWAVIVKVKPTVETLGVEHFEA